MKRSDPERSDEVCSTRCGATLRPKRAAGFVLAAVAVLTMLAGWPSPAQAAETTDCPEMTDSVGRLYSAYFKRQPDGPGRAYWVDRYSSGSRNLRQISEYFAVAPEFEELYGSLNNQQFVSRIYSNVLGRLPDDEGAQYWTRRLDSGLSRGALMIGFSESAEYVSITKTALPLAGPGRIYPVGTAFVCGRGLVGRTIRTGNRDVHVDVFGINTDPRREQNLAVWIGSAGRREGTLVSNEVIKPNEYLLTWNGMLPAALDGRVARPVSLAGSANSSLHWVVVAYPARVAPDRPVWDEGRIQQLR